MLSYSQSRRDADVTALTDIEIGDGQVIQAGATVHTELNTNMLPIRYAYSFVKDESHELALSLGVHWNRVEFVVDASAWVEDEGGRRRVEAKADAPLPLIGLAYDYYLSPRWAINLSGELFYLKLNSNLVTYQGSLYNARLGTEYWLSNHFGVGGAVSVFGLDVDVDDPDWKGSLDFRYWGPQLYVVGRF
jgi:hypothetical protein